MLDMKKKKIGTNVWQSFEAQINLSSLFYKFLSDKAKKRKVS